MNFNQINIVMSDREFTAECVIKTHLLSEGADDASIIINFVPL